MFERYGFFDGSRWGAPSALLCALCAPAFRTCFASWLSGAIRVFRDDAACSCTCGRLLKCRLGPPLAVWGLGPCSACTGTAVSEEGKSWRLLPYLVGTHWCGLMW
eukprot:2458254-Pleurochrysis_carterae.AAC.1